MPSASTSRSLYSNFAYSAITRNVVVKQLATALSSKSSGVHLPSRPPNSGGAVKWIALGAELDFASPVLPKLHQAMMRYFCAHSIVNFLPLIPSNQALADIRHLTANDALS